MQLCLILAALCAVATTGTGSAADIAAVKAVADGICTITACGVKTNGIAFVDYVLRPEAESDIRCRLELPPPEKWNGEFWGTGNSSFGGTMPGMSDLPVRLGAASVTTDMGTSRYCDYGDLKDKPVPKAVLRDFYWRSTHLMTVYGKRMAKAFYGRDPSHSFFRGGSRGGHQGMSEVLRYPEDYDGVISSIPAGFLAPSSAQFVNLYGQTHDAAGKPLVTREQLRIIADAPIEYMKDREPRPYAGKVLSNPFLGEKDVDGFLALAAKKDPALGDPDLLRRLKNVFMGVSRGGKVLCHGMTPGAFMGFERGRSYENRGSLLMELYYRQRGDNTLATWDEFEAEVRRANGYSSASSTDLRAFRARGGKLIVLCGWEDQTTPSPEMVAWYEMLAERFGGYGRTQEFCRLFPLPGHAHGGGKGRISTGGGYGLGHLNQLRRWVEEGVAPETYPHRWEEENLTFPIPPYPLMCYQDESGAWKTKRYPEGMVRRPDPSYYACELDPAALLRATAGADGVRMAEVAAFEQLADLAVRLPPQIRTSGIGTYSTNRLGFAMNNGLAMTAKGRLWASWIAGGDGPNSFTVASHSDDRGETWSDVALVIDGHGEVPTRGNFCGRTNIIGTFWLDPDGKFRLYTDQTLLHFDGRAGIWESVAVDPDAKVSSWGEPRRIGHGHLINKPIVLSNGDWAMAGYMTVTWTNSNYACVAGAFAELDAERGTTCYVSADRGATWEKRGTVRGLESDWNESQLVELKDGRLRVFMRATVGYGRMMVADSTDGGRTWTKPFSLPSMDNPNSRFQVTRLKGGRLLFVTHGAPAASCKDNQGRDRLTAYLSEDDGATWLGGLELWHGSASYPDCCQGPDGTIYVTHDHDRGGAAEIWLHRFTERDVLAGRIVSREGKLNLLVSRGMGSAANRSR